MRTDILGRWVSSATIGISQSIQTTELEFLKDGTVVFGKGGTAANYSFPEEGRIKFAGPGLLKVYNFSISGEKLNFWGDIEATFYRSAGAMATAEAETSPVVLLATWGNYGSGDGEFIEPIAIAVDGSGNVYVADTGNRRVQKFSSRGAFLADRGIYAPIAIAVDGSGNVYVADSDSCRVQKFSSSGAFLARWDRDTEGSSYGGFDLPGGIAVDGSGNVYVADTGNHRVQKFNSRGALLARWGTGGIGDDQFRFPTGIAVDGSGNVYVADTGNRRVQKFSSSGAFLANWGTQGSGDVQFSEPSGIAVDGSGNVYVADSGNHRVQVFRQK